MPIQIYNSLTKKKEDFDLPKGRPVKIYTCGVTVYDQCHIGHARSLYVFDVIRRYLKYRGYDVRFIRNITDIDDKIINRAKELNKTSEQVAQQNIDDYYRDLAALQIDRADEEPRATQNIPEMISHIEGLIGKKYAYVLDGSVYFRVRAFKDYGKLSGQSIEKMMDGVRIEKDERKEDPLDFALWKKSKEGEPAWDSPWGKGRPGWHIECSCMSMKYLKSETLDVHAGGRDLIFPHHENEIAQSEALTGKPFAKYWLHHGLLTINGQKMAKSMGNFITVQDAIRKYGVNDLKFFFLSSHYTSPIDFSEDKMAEAHNAMKRVEVLLYKVHKIESSLKTPGPLKSEYSKNLRIEFLEKFEKDFSEAMDDDFNTPQALAAIFDLISSANKYLESQFNSIEYTEVLTRVFYRLLEICEKIFGLQELTYWEPLLDEEEKLLKERKEARARKDFKKSDQIRGQLLERGIIIEDTKDGQVWRRA